MSVTEHRYAEGGRTRYLVRWREPQLGSRTQNRQLAFDREADARAFDMLQRRRAKLRRRGNSEPEPWDLSPPSPDDDSPAAEMARVMIEIALREQAAPLGLEDPPRWGSTLPGFDLDPQLRYAVSVGVAVYLDDLFEAVAEHRRFQDQRWSARQRGAHPSADELPRQFARVAGLPEHPALLAVYSEGQFMRSFQVAAVTYLARLDQIDPSPRSTIEGLVLSGVVSEADSCLDLMPQLGARTRRSLMSELEGLHRQIDPLGPLDEGALLRSDPDSLTRVVWSWFDSADGTRLHPYLDPPEPPAGDPQASPVTTL